MIIPILLGITLRLSMFIVSKSMWGDEIYSLWASQQPLSSFLSFNHPPLYYEILRLFHSEVAYRLFSISCGVGTIIVTYLLASKLFSRSVGSVSAFLVAISPYFLQSSFEIRAYSLLGFLSTLCILMFVQKRWWEWLILASILPWIEHVGIFVTLATFCLWIYQQEEASSVKICAICVSIMGWFLLVAHQLTDENPLDPSHWDYHGEVIMMVKKVGGAFIHSHVGYRYSMLTVDSLPFSYPWFWVLALASITVFGFAVNGWRATSHSVKWIIFVPLILLFYPTKFHARYLVEVMPLYYVFIAAGIEYRD